MNINVIFLDYHRHDYTEQVKAQNFHNAGHPFDHVIIDTKGISAALNAGIKQSLHYDGIVTMANDILMPDNWLAEMVRAAEAIPNTGMAGIHCVEDMNPMEEINGVKVHPNYTAFGNVLIPMKAIQTIGLFNEDYDPYGMQDADYAHRLNNTGFINYYVHGLKSQHIGADVGNGTEYRKMKDEGLATAGEKWEKWNHLYKVSNNYTIGMEEWQHQ